jgi:magnesium-transporting ATPase (P-type)
MWPVELYMWMFVDAARYSASCTSRPRLPSSISFRPSPSMFHPSCIFPTVAQAGVHLLSMAIGVNYARQLEAKGTDKKKSSIRLSNSPHPAKAGKLLSALAARDWGAEESDDNGEQQNTGLLRRPAFRANYETNAVFIFSVLQSAIVNVLNHEGKPFYRSILESQELCFISLLTMVFSLALVLESFPLINRLLELRTLPSLKSKFTFLGIATLNVGACVFCQLLSDTWFREKTGKYPVRKRKERNAADMEEDLLREESKENLKTVFLAVGFGAILVVEMIAKHSR